MPPLEPVGDRSPHLRRVCTGADRQHPLWQHILQTLVCYRLIDPGSEW
jgi:hypothetical protein